MRELAKPVAFSEVVSPKIIDHWIAIKNQIAMVELFAPIVALATFSEKIRNKKILIFVDSEVA